MKRKSDFFADHIDVMGTRFPLSERRPKRIDVQKHHFVNANEIVGVPGSKQFLKQKMAFPKCPKFEPEGLGIVHVVFNRKSATST